MSAQESAVATRRRYESVTCVWCVVCGCAVWGVCGVWQTHALACVGRNSNGSNCHVVIVHGVSSLSLLRDTRFRQAVR